MKIARLIQYTLVVLLVVLLVWKGFYFKSWTEVSKKVNEKFNAKSYAVKLWKEQLPAKLEAALSFEDFLKQASAPERLQKLTNSLSIGNIRHALLKMDGVVKHPGTDGFLLQLTANGDSLELPVELEFVYGNSLRDASELVKIEDFPNSDQLNSISEALNDLVRKEVIAGLRNDLKEGQRISITAAVELNTAHFKPGQFTIIPVRYTIQP